MIYYDIYMIKYEQVISWSSDYFVSTCLFGGGFPSSTCHPDQFKGPTWANTGDPQIGRSTVSGLQMFTAKLINKSQIYGSQYSFCCRPGKLPTETKFPSHSASARGASKGEGLGNQFLGNIRNVGAAGGSSIGAFLESHAGDGHCLSAEDAKTGCSMGNRPYTLWKFNIAIEHGGWVPLVPSSPSAHTARRCHRARDSML